MTGAKTAWVLALSLTLGNVLAADEWLPVLASEKTIGAAVERLRTLGGSGAGLELIAANDCANLRKGYFLVVAGVSGNRAQAEAKVAHWRSQGARGAYARKCEIVPGSRIALNLKLLDDSIYERPASIVNWDYKDALSATRSLSGSMVALIRPTYSPDPEDVREGLRIAVDVLLRSSGERVHLEDDCIDPQMVSQSDLVVVSCVRATMADELLHVTRVYRMPSGTLLQSVEQCRAPRFDSDRGLICQKETLSKGGQLKLHVIEVSY